jgi:Protein of unknown function (DUF2892)
MNRNMSNLDRALPSFLIAPAAVAVAVAIGGGSIAGIVLVVAVMMLATSAISFCPLYKLLRLNTRGRMPLPH